MRVPSEKAFILHFLTSGTEAAPSWSFSLTKRSTADIHWGGESCGRDPTSDQKSSAEWQRQRKQPRKIFRPSADLEHLEQDFLEFSSSILRTLVLLHENPLAFSTLSLDLQTSLRFLEKWNGPDISDSVLDITSAL